MRSSRSTGSSCLLEGSREEACPEREQSYAVRQHCCKVKGLLIRDGLRCKSCTVRMCCNLGQLMNLAVQERGKPVWITQNDVTVT